MIDLLIIETGSGGDLVISGSDLVAVMGLENQPYLAMFGDDGSWWGNFLMADGQDNEFVSLTEDVLNKIVLNSNGRLKVEAAINQDLAYLTADVPGTTITIETKIVTAIRMDIRITINGKLFSYSWNPNEASLTPIF